MQDVTTNIKNIQFIEFLKKFELEILRMPWSYVTPSKVDIKKRLDHIFDHYININLMTYDDINRMMKLIDTNGINHRVKSLITAVLVCELDELNTSRSYKTKRTFVDDHLFKTIC